jgi:hypothetical protein
MTKYLVIGSFIIVCILGVAAILWLGNGQSAAVQNGIAILFSPMILIIAVYVALLVLLAIGDSLSFLGFLIITAIFFMFFMATFGNKFSSLLLLQPLC